MTTFEAVWCQSYRHFTSSCSSAWNTHSKEEIELWLIEYSHRLLNHNKKWNTHVWDPFMFAVCTTLLIHKRCKIGCSFCTAWPILETFVEDCCTRMMNTFGIIACMWFIRLAAATVFTNCSDWNFTAIERINRE